MHIREKSKLELEILISTMNRTNLSFLDEMFKNEDLACCPILIINQTTEQHLLTSNSSNIRVINSLEKGLTKSRNLAIENTHAKYGLFADDDVIFEKGFLIAILQAFEAQADAVMISFMASDLNGNAYRAYFDKSRKHDLLSIKGLMSIEIAVNVQLLKGSKMRFNERFGLGSEFQTSEEYLFARDLILAGHSCFFSPKTIVSHDHYNSGKDLGSDAIVYARAALNYKLHQKMAYIWLTKYLFFLIRNGYIQFSDLKHKWNIGINGINAYIHPENN